MPPKKELAALKKELLQKQKQQKKKAEKEEAVVAARYVPKEPGVKKLSEEEQRRKFFKNLYEDGDELTNKELLNRLKEFSLGKDRDFTRENFIKRAIRYLPRDNIFEYSREYFLGEQQSDILLAKYISSEEVQEVYKEEEKYAPIPEKEEEEEEIDYEEDVEEDAEEDVEDAETGEEIEKLLEKSFEKLFVEEEEEEPEKVTEEEVEEEEKPEKDTDGEYANVFLEKEEEEEEIQDMPLLPEIGIKRGLPFYPVKDIKKAIPLGKELEPLPTGEVKPKIIVRKDEDITDPRCESFYYNTPWLDQRALGIYVIPESSDQGKEFYIDKPRQIDKNTTIYPITREFVKAQCGIGRNRREFRSPYLYILNKDGEEVGFEVIFELPNEFTYLDESMFEEEKSLYRQTLLTVDKRVTTFGERLFPNVSETDKSIIKDDMKKHLTAALSFIKNKDLVNNTVDLYMRKYSEDSINNLLTAFSVLLTYVDKRVLDIAGIFKERIERSYYDSNALYSLTNTEVLPEVYIDPSTSEGERSSISLFLGKLSGIIYTDLLYQIYYDTHPLERRVYPMQRQVLLVQFEGKGEGIRSLCKNKEDIREDIEPYSLYIYKDDDGEYYCFDLLQGIDPEGEYISGTNYYNKQNLPDEVYQDLVRISQEVERQDIVAPKEVKKDKVEVIKIPEERTPGLFIFIMEDILDLEKELGKRGRDYIKDLERVEFDHSLTEKEEDKDKIEDLTKKIEDICIYCKKHIEDTSLTSIRQGKEGSEIVNFCNTDCFEKMEEWPNLRKRIDKLKFGGIEIEDYSTVESDVEVEIPAPDTYQRKTKKQTRKRR